MVSDTPARNGDASSVIDAFLGAGPGNLPLSYERLHIDVSGPESAQPVVVLHGWGSSARLMSPVAATLSSDFFVHNIDMPGHGLSPQPPAPCGLEEQASLVRQYIEDKLSPPVILFGHSNGGRIGLYLASRPDTAHLIDKLVLVSPSGIRPNRGPAYYFKSNLAKLLKLPTRFLRGRFKEHVMDWLTHSLVWKMLGSSDYNALTGTMRQSFVATVNFHVDDMIRNINCPTLIFWGDKDTAVSLRQMQKLESGIADCGLVILKGAGHYGYLDQPGVVMAATRHFLGAGDANEAVHDAATAAASAT